MKKFLNYILILFCIVIIILGIIYAFYHWNDTFISGLTGNFLATIGGVIIGIPIALWLNREQLRREDLKRKEAANKRSKELLNLLKVELKSNLSIIPKRKGIPEMSQAFPFKTELWNSFSLSGELKWIPTQQLVADLSAAYHLIKHIRKLEEIGIEIINRPINRFDKVTSHPNNTYNTARAFDQRLSILIKHAVKEIDKYLSR